MKQGQSNFLQWYNLLRMLLNNREPNILDQSKINYFLKMDKEISHIFEIELLYQYWNSTQYSDRICL